MKFLSTRGDAPPATLCEALRSGAAPDGGLYMPEEFPHPGDVDPREPLAKFSETLLKSFFAGDPLEAELAHICAEAFDFALPLVISKRAQPNLHILELFHGPTGAFKDFGARFLMSCFDRLAKSAPLTVLAATSGDTGGAVGCAAEGRSSIRAMILYPSGRVSPFQERQLTCWGANIEAVEVEGDFDDCQRLVKEAFADEQLTLEYQLTSANSINIGRLLAQVAYCAWAASQVHAQTGATPGFVVPSGNLGHGFAMLLARAMGLPIGPIILASNANRTLKDWHDSGRFEPRPSISTVANAMDVGNPSNFERVAALPADAREVRVELVTDEQIKARIRSEYETSGYIWCPHSATAAEAFSRLSDAQRTQKPWIAAATAHPYKFAEIVEPLIGRKIEPSPALAAIFARPTRKVRIGANLGSLADALRQPAIAA